MLLDGLAIVILALFVLLGAQRGALRSGLSLVGLGASYGAALLAAPLLGAPLGAALGLPALVGGMLAGSAAFAVVSVAFAVAVRRVRRREAAAGRDRSRPLFDALGGGCFGALRGALVVVLVAWLAQWTDAAAELRGSERRPLTENSAAGTATQRLVEAGVARALGGSNPGATVTARLLARPREALVELQSVVEHPRVGSLAQDRVFWEMVDVGAIDAALRRPSFVSIARDRELRARLVSVGVIEESAAADPAAFRHSARRVLEEVGPRLRRLRQDPELHRLATDPQVVSLLENGQTLGLLQHPGFQRVVARALQDDATEGPTERDRS